MEALSVVPVAVEGPPRVGSSTDPTGLENTVDDKSKCNIKKLVMSETLMWIRYMVRDIGVGLVPESLVGEIRADGRKERIVLIYPKTLALLLAQMHTRVPG